MTDSIEARITSALIDEIFRNVRTGFYIQITDHFSSAKCVTQELYDRGWNGVVGIPNSREPSCLNKRQPKSHFVNVPPCVVASRSSVMDVGCIHNDGGYSQSDDLSAQSKALNELLSSIRDVLNKKYDEIIELIFIKLDLLSINFVTSELVREYRPRMIVLERSCLADFDAELGPIGERYYLGFSMGSIRLYCREEDKFRMLPSLRAPLEIYQQRVDAWQASFDELSRSRLEAESALHFAKSETRTLIQIMGAEVAAGLPNRRRDDLAFVLPYYTDERRPGAQGILKSLLGAPRWYMPRFDKRVERALKARTRVVVQSGLFDGSWYLQQYPDVAIAKIDPLSHFVNHGSLELRHPGPGFDSNAYLRRNTDVAAAGREPFLHYLIHGRAEGRFEWRMS